MGEVSWIKIQTDLFENRKIRQIMTLPEGDSIVLIWVRLLTIAGEINDGGAIYLTKRITYSPETLAAVFGKSEELIADALSIFADYNMIEIDEDGMIFITNWEKYQNIEKMEQLREQNRVRQARHREKIREQAAKLRPKTPAERQQSLRAKQECEKQHIPTIDNSTNRKRYGGNYYLVMQRDGFKCAMCGRTDRLNVHHIDGYDENAPQNNAMNKLVVLCPSCHGEVHGTNGDVPDEVLDAIGYWDEGDEVCHENNKNLSRHEICHAIEEEEDKDKEEDIDIESPTETDGAHARAREGVPSKRDIQNYIKERGYDVDADRFMTYYSQRGWRAKNGNLILDRWKAVLDSWAKNEIEDKPPDRPPKRVPKNAAAKTPSSFEADDYFKAALRRSYGEDISDERLNELVGMASGG